MLHKRTLRGLLLWYLLVPLGVLWVFNAVIVFYLAESFSNRAYDLELYDTTRFLAQQIHAPETGSLRELPGAAWEMVHYDERDKIFSQVKWVDGETIAGNSSLDPPPVGLRRVGMPVFHDSIYQGQPIRVASLYVPVVARGVSRQLLVQTAETLNKRHILQHEIISGVLLPQLVLIVLAAMSVWLGVRRGLMPLQQVRQAIASRSERDLSPLAEQNAPHEIQPLLRAINGLMQKLGQTLEVQQRFVADAAHQLRTPLAGLTTQSEYALRQTDPESLRRSLDQIRTSAERTNRLIHQLLMLARSETSRDTPAVFEQLDLNALTREVASEWVPRAMSRDVDLGFEGQDGIVTISGNRILLHEMLANLIDNAIRYIPAGGKVTVRLSHPRQPLISVEDNGLGIPVEERERVFERFHRLPGTGGDGSGLGLAIVREIARTHGALVWITEGTGGKGARACVQFGHSA